MSNDSASLRQYDTFISLEWHCKWTEYSYQLHVEVSNFHFGAKTGKELLPDVANKIASI
jgi:hypothetical protein